MKNKMLTKTLLSGIGLVISLLFAASVSAHCDSFDGPIIPEAQEALKNGEVQPLLKWVEPQHEAEITAAFERARNVSEQSPAAKDLAETWFLETFVRLHREGEGAAYTGLKPAGVMPAFYQRADAALDEGSVNKLADDIGNTIAQEIRDRFAVAHALQKDAEKSTDDGRKFVAAYVDYFHFIEALHYVLDAEHHDHH